MNDYLELLNKILEKAKKRKDKEEIILVELEIVKAMAEETVAKS